ncbi:MAG: protein kinase [Phycisphaerales bacterium]|nr:protein kinase [Phycisphaerales bacterium]
MTTPDRWQLIRQLFAEAAELPQADRAAFLARRCPADDTLRAEVQALLDAIPASRSRPGGPSPLRTGGAAAAIAEGATGSVSPFVPITETAGTVIGPYKLLQRIGEGGFGTVFMAEQTAPVRRKVALKIIKLGMDTRQVVARFEAERQALAIMDHPHIARVLDGGATETGRPYFVMEYVVGDAITKFADAHALTLAERLGLFQQVCSAVQHAHQKGIIHRDLKPGNVLVSMVDGKPFAKVIDFGIAKATGAAGGRLTDATYFTEHRQLIGTPEYMSPEQAEGSLDIDTRTDVYSLGVLLYELLTGSTPIEGARLRSAAHDEMRRMIREDEPLAPSMKLSRSLATLASTAAARKVEPGRLSALVKGELDWIVLKALEKERARRYETASALADDVKRHLSGEPVVAAPVSVGYRVRKFVRRNKGAVTAASAVGLALLVGLAGTTWQYRSAEHQAFVAGQNAARAFMAQEEAEWSAYTANLALAQQALAAHDYPEFRRVLARAPKDKAGWEHRYLSLEAERFVGFGPSGDLAWTEPRFSADSAAVAAAYTDNAGRSMVGVWDGRTGGQVWMSPPLARQPVHAVLPPGDADVLLVWPDAEGGGTGVLDRRSGTLRLPQAPAGQFVDAAWFPPAAGLVALDGPHGSALIWDTRAASPRPVRAAASPAGPPAPAYEPLGPEGGRLAVRRGAGAVDVVDAATGRVLHTIDVQGQEIRDIAISGDGARLLVMTKPAAARVIAADTGEVIARFVLPYWHSRAVFSADGRSIIAGEALGTIAVFDAATGADRPDLLGVAAPAAAGFVSPDGAHAAYLSHHESSRPPLPVVENLRALGGAEVNYWTTHADLAVAAITAGAPPTSGLTLTTPDGTRRITAGGEAGGSTIRFLDAGPGGAAGDREVAVFRLDKAVSTLQLTADGTRLIIRLEDGSARVWDIRDPEVRRKDLQAHWAERVPARAYLDALWASDTPDDKLRDAVINDASLTPLRRLVAAEMLVERREDDRLAAEEAFNEIRKAVEPASGTNAASPIDPAAITAEVRTRAAAAAELPNRVKARVIAKAAGWEYRKPEASDAEKLATERGARVIAEAQLTKFTFDLTHASADRDDKLQIAYSAMRDLLGPDHPDTLDILRKMAFGSLSQQRRRDALDLLDARFSRVARSSGLATAEDFADAHVIAELSVEARRFDRAAELFRLMGRSIPALYKTLGAGFLKWTFRYTPNLGDADAIGFAHLAQQLHNITPEELRAKLTTHLIRSIVGYARTPFVEGDPEWRRNNTLLYAEQLRDLAQDDADASLALALGLLRLGELEGALEFAERATRLRATAPIGSDATLIALVRHALASSSPATLAAAGEVDMKADPSLKAPLTPDEHRQRAREALAKARALMQPAADGTPSPWVNDEDAKALLAEATALIEGSASPAPTGGRP